ncbi:actin-like ATPase domain-containing protein [Mycena sp. CBHHK59/15]|nr:actin-like ATPase domain-containing protein [Mycena sp. CBHHK59/15]
MAPLFLGLDLSTQQLKAVLIAEDASVVHESAVHFDNDLPQYGTTNGAIRGPGRERYLAPVTSPVAMFLDAMDLLMDRMKKAGIQFGEIAAISGAGQQHGSVYWSKTAEDALATLDAASTLTDQLSHKAFSIQRAPIWQDSSTTEECKALEDAIGGPQALADLSGSRAYERFTGTQIAKIRRLKPEAYEATSRISLVSSFMPSLFLGHIAPIEVSDASGMNLMDVLTCKWDDRLLDACAGPGGTCLGKISDWWIRRWGFNSDCIIAPFTGDNPASVVALSAPGDALLSLGTSTTLCSPKRFTTSHLLAHPTTLDAQIAMLCYKNGALAREQVRDQYTQGNWQPYNATVEDTPPGNNGYMGLYFPLPEIIPPNIVGNFFYQVKAADQVSATESIPDHAHPRAILESQFLSIRSRIAAILPPHAPRLHRLVYVSHTKEAAGMGGALLAKYAWWKEVHGGTGTFEEMTGGEVVGMQCVAEPRPAVAKVYDGLVGVYQLCEEDAVKRAA